VRRPVFSFQAELLTDAPFEHIRARVLAVGPEGFKSLRALTRWAVPEVSNDRLVLRWFRTVGGAEESGTLVLAPDPKGAHLRLEGRLSGWAGFLLLGLLRWRTDRLLDRFVEEL
jgi:hypothetical protein